jgi:hypothetical protein
MFGRKDEEQDFYLAWIRAGVRMRRRRDSGSGSDNDSSSWKTKLQSIISQKLSGDGLAHTNT